MGDRPLKPRCMNHILTDDLLLEIILMLPSAESATRCKCVCKHWYGLISSPDFPTRFVARKISGNTISKERVGWEEVEDRERQHPSSIFIRRGNDNNACVIFPFHPLFTSPRFSLGFIPGYEGGESCAVEIAWCGDLLLCIGVSPEELDLYVCNPRTEQWLRLPRPPSFCDLPCLSGLICDPYYIFDEQNGSVIPYLSSRFWVCYAFSGVDPKARLDVEIYSSEAGAWRKAALLSPEPFDFSVAEAYGWFAYNGMLLFHSGDAILCFDPQGIPEGGGVVHGRHIRMPPNASPAESSCRRSVCLGVYRGRVRIVQLCARFVNQQEVVDITRVSIEDDDNNTASYDIKVWELRDCSSGEWSLERTVYVRDLVSEDNDDTINQHVKRGCPNAMLLCSHPYEPDIVLLRMLGRRVGMGLPRQIVECNLREKTLKAICGFPKDCGLSRVALRWWPSPLPQRLCKTLGV